MTIEQIEQRLLVLLDQCDGLAVPAADLAEATDLTKHGEPGVALELLCTQLDEYDVPVPPALLAGLRELGTAMRIDESYWTRLKPADPSDG
jgi:hypothetical protein